MNELISQVINSATPGVPGGEEIINLLFPNIWVFLTHIVATIILLALVIFFVWKPTKKYLKKRREAIQKEIIEAENKNKLASEDLEKAHIEVMQSKSTASSIIEQAQMEAHTLKEDAAKSALKSSNQIRLEAEIAIKKREEDLQSQIKSQISDVAFTAAESLIIKEIDRESNQKIVDNAIEEFSKRELK